MKITKTLDLQKDGDWIIGSTPSPDRDQDRVIPSGIDVSNFQKNPTLFFGHNYSDPWALIGKVAEFSIGGDGLKFRPELRNPVNDGDPMTIIKSLWDSGLLRAASIGFIPKSGKPNELGGTDFTNIELLEISIVPIPANQEALRLSMKALGASSADVSNGGFRLAADGSIEVWDAPITKAMEQIELKRGRVLSSANETKLRGAYEQIGSVLAQIAQEPEQNAPEQEPEVKQDEPDIDTALAAELGEMLKAVKQMYQ